ncbi:hypothetical protein [Streptomyces chiangmaiensis]|uniref:Uncharacterized protein n=1 Tax=Streptomyces chiangmaiensis TaxID=766497 RepID=A0ABU7FAU6_9ACTN|nr:hypothetical protein [Streptomyces chiangmaiensis]MED7821306.1 hypothetical protein [Streptomyces chiangmaiensis]
MTFRDIALGDEVGAKVVAEVCPSADRAAGSGGGLAFTGHGGALLVGRVALLALALGVGVVLAVRRRAAA